ncbi:ABC transporter permease [Frateuria soli]|uniref:ABC transporter permease n=1 Tax=Frateuria soli TaxID=1542730 RepID=UPI001E44C817|nr:FtsX-like permease family protein [Frateuria soli]UGB37462.1 ABC transporter permease [Frateuria soli]
MDMQVGPILSALRRHKAGAVLIALQVALTLAILCNALFIVHQRLSHLSEPTGLDEANIFVIQNEWAGKASYAQLDAEARADLEVLRRLPGVADVTTSNSYPLRGAGWDDGIRLRPGQLTDTTGATVYFADEHFVRTLGLKLVAGRDFRAGEIGVMAAQDRLDPAQVIITRALADTLFHGDGAVGRTLYLAGNPATIVGVVERLQAQSVARWAADFAHRVVIVPRRLTSTLGTYYIVRTHPGQLAAAMRAAPAALVARNPRRMFDPRMGVLSFAQVRERAYESDRGMATLMGVISAVLLAITAAGIVGVTSFRVGQRRRQIGVRRALGATRRDIVRYFLVENLLVSGGGILLGVLLALAMNLWLILRFGMQGLSPTYLAAGVAVLLLLGQAAALAPALRASRVPPVEATRAG